MPVPARADVVRAADDYRFQEDGKLGWDRRTGQPTFTETIDTVHERLQTQSQWMIHATDELDVVDWPHLQALPDHDEIRDEDHFLPWLAPIDYALAHGHPLFADDLVLRIWARSAGVPAFGTVALLRVLPTVSATELTYSLDVLRREYCVDLPFDFAALTRIAAQDHWAPGPAAYPFRRPATWLASDRAYRAWQHMCRQAAAADPRQVPGWLYAAVWGAARGKQPHQVTTIAAALLFSITFTVAAPADIFPDLLSAARGAASELGGSDLLPAAIANMLELFTRVHGPEQSARIVLALAAHLEDQDRTLVREIVFAPNEA